MRKCLIVEDDREIRKVLKNFLAESDYEIEETGDGRAASRIMAEKHGA